MCSRRRSELNGNSVVRADVAATGGRAARNGLRQCRLDSSNAPPVSYTTSAHMCTGGQANNTKPSGRFRPAGCGAAAGVRRADAHGCGALRTGVCSGPVALARLRSAPGGTQGDSRGRGARGHTRAGALASGQLEDHDSRLPAARLQLSHHMPHQEEAAREGWLSHTATGPTGVRLGLAGALGSLSWGLGADSANPWGTSGMMDRASWAITE